MINYCFLSILFHWNSQSKHLNYFINWNFCIFKSCESNSSWSGSYKNSIQFLNITKIDLVVHSRHAYYQFVKANFIGSFICEFMKYSCQINSLLQNYILWLGSKSLNDISILVTHLHYSLPYLFAHRIN